MGMPLWFANIVAEILFCIIPDPCLSLLKNKQIKTWQKFPVEKTKHLVHFSGVSKRHHNRFPSFWIMEKLEVSWKISQVTPSFSLLDVHPLLLGELQKRGCNWAICFRPKVLHKGQKSNIFTASKD